MPGPGGGLSDIDRLTNAAISAAMAEEKLFGESPSGGYKGDDRAYVNSDGILRWPDGHPYDPELDYTGSWNQWRGAIEGLVQPWEDMPTLGPFQDQVDALTSTVKKLRPGVQAEGSGAHSSIVGGGKLRDAIGSLAGDLSGMDGQTIWTFRTKYVDHLHTVNEGQFALAYVLGQCVSAEQSIWDKAQLDYWELIKQGTAAFEAVAHLYQYGGGGGDYSTELKVAGAIFGLVGIFATGGVATAAAIGGFGVSLLEDFAPKGKTAPKPKISGSTANAVFQSLSDALDDLRDEILKQEKAIHDCLQANLGKVKKTPHTFDLSSPAILTKDKPEAIGFRVDQTRMRLCGTKTCPRVADGFKDAAASAQGGFGAGPWTRPSYFGAATGAYPTYAALLGELEYAADNTAYEITSAGKVLAASADYFDDADGNAEQALTKLHKLVKGYQAHYPDRPSEASVPTGPRGAGSMTAI